MFNGIYFVYVPCSWPKSDLWWPALSLALVTSENPSYPTSERPISSRLSDPFLPTTGTDHWNRSLEQIMTGLMPCFTSSGSEGVPFGVVVDRSRGPTQHPLRPTL